tara:strand:- start:13 stop:498 length:486 start_codon:yes stop_codon:yes gene_type:complete
MGDSVSPTESERIDSLAGEIYSELNSCRAQLMACEKKVRALERRAKQLARTKRKSRPGGAGRKPTGFARPTPVSDALTAFMGLPEDQLVARTDATRAINAYIKEHGLQDPTDARRIIPDDKLRSLLGLVDAAAQEEPLTYFNLQQHMNTHFQRPPGASAEV